MELSLRAASDGGKSAHRGKEPAMMSQPVWRVSAAVTHRPVARERRITPASQRSFHHRPADPQPVEPAHGEVRLLDRIARATAPPDKGPPRAGAREGGDRRAGSTPAPGPPCAVRVRRTQIRILPASRSGNKWAVSARYHLGTRSPVARPEKICSAISRAAGLTARLSDCAIASV